MDSDTRSTSSPGDISQAALTETLPEAVQRALENYRILAFVDAPEDAKEFQQHQAACKAALQHVDALMKLLNAIDASTMPDQRRVAQASMLARAEAAVEAFGAATPNETESEDDT